MVRQEEEEEEEVAVVVEGRVGGEARERSGAQKGISSLDSFSRCRALNRTETGFEKYQQSR
jgi:hypothetical protein